MTATTPAGLRGEQLVEIANAISSLMREFYGRGPEQAKAYALDDVVVVVLRGGLTTVEQTLLAGGRIDMVREVRLTFQQLMADPFKEAVAQVAGRPVRGYMSQLVPETETTFEIFQLAVDPA